MELLDFAIAELREMKMQPSLERALRHKGLLGRKAPEHVPSPSMGEGSRLPPSLVGKGAKGLGRPRR